MKKVLKHPAYGYAELREASINNPSFLFGSDVPNRSVFELSIYEGVVEDDGKRKRYYPDEGDPIVSIELSELQLMGLLCGKNSAGIPVTLRQRGANRIAPLPPPQTAEDRSAATYEEGYDDSINACKEAMEIIKSASDGHRSLKAGERDTIFRLIGFARTQMETGREENLRSYRSQMERIRIELVPEGKEE